MKKEGQLLHVLIPSTKTKVSQEFLITVGSFEGMNMIEVIENHAVRGWFFVGYRGGNRLPTFLIFHKLKNTQSIVVEITDNEDTKVLLTPLTKISAALK